MSSICLIDTSVVSELARPAPNPGVLTWMRGLGEVSISTVTVEEIYFGLSKKANLRLEQWFDDFFLTGCSLLPVSREVAAWSGHWRGTLERRGETRTQADLLIAGTAWVWQMTLATRNVADFRGLPIRVVHPFGPPSPG